MRDQVTVRGTHLKVKYVYEDSTNNRKISAITTATTQNSGTIGQMPIKPTLVSGLSKEHSVDRWGRCTHEGTKKMSLSQALVSAKPEKPVTPL